MELEAGVRVVCGGQVVGPSLHTRHAACLRCHELHGSGADCLRTSIKAGGSAAVLSPLPSREPLQVGGDDNGPGAPAHAHPWARPGLELSLSPPHSPPLLPFQSKPLVCLTGRQERAATRREGAGGGVPVREAASPAACTTRPFSHPAGWRSDRRRHSAGVRAHTADTFPLAPPQQVNWGGQGGRHPGQTATGPFSGAQQRAAEREAWWWPTHTAEAATVARDTQQPPSSYRPPPPPPPHTSLPPHSSPKGTTNNHTAPGLLEAHTVGDAGPAAAAHGQPAPRRRRPVAGCLVRSPPLRQPAGRQHRGGAHSRTRYEFPPGAAAGMLAAAGVGGHNSEHGAAEPAAGGRRRAGAARHAGEACSPCAKCKCARATATTGG